MFASKHPLFGSLSQAKMESPYEIRFHCQKKFFRSVVVDVVDD
jgi:hypothetical protein